MRYVIAALWALSTGAAHADLLIRAEPGPLVAKWDDARAKIAADHKRLDACERGHCAPAEHHWRAIETALRKRSGVERLGWLNREINRSIHYAPDSAIYGVPDYWAGPLETLSLGRGDCEDYAIAKYGILARLEGSGRLQLLVGRTGRVAHMVLAVRHDDVSAILDNRRSALALRPDFIPSFVLTENGTFRLLSTLSAVSKGEIFTINEVLAKKKN
jgi:predicted transglutaminase-like cysteine proteinase